MINYIYVFPDDETIVEIPTKHRVHPLISITPYLISIAYPENQLFYFCSEQYFTLHNPFNTSKVIWFQTCLDTINSALSGNETDVGNEISYVPEHYKKLISLEILLIN